MSNHRTGAGAAINPDSIWMFRFVAIGVFIVFAASVTISSFGLYAVGIAQGLPPNVAWVTPVMIDVPILVFTGAALIQKRRGNRFARVFASFGVGFMTLVSAILNYLHSYYAIGIDTIEGATGTAVNTLAPVLIFMSTETLVFLVTKQAPAPRAQATPAPRKKSTTTSRKRSTSKPATSAPSTERATPSSAPPPSPAPRPAWQPTPERESIPAFSGESR